MRTSAISTITLVILTVLSLSCGSKRGLVKLDADDTYARGMQFFEREKYVDAMEDFKDLAFNYPGTPVGIKGSYYLAECYRITKDYEAAIDEYQHILNDYSGSEYAAAAQYQIAVCCFKRSPNYALDQTDTGEKAKNALELFFERFSDSPLKADAQQLMIQVKEKLAHKDFDAGKFYFKREEYLAAKIYFDGLIRDYPETSWAGQAAELLPEVQQFLPPAADSLIVPNDNVSPQPADSTQK